MYTMLTWLSVDDNTADIISLAISSGVQGCQVAITVLVHSKEEAWLVQTCKSAISTAVSDIQGAVDFGMDVSGPLWIGHVD